MLHQSSSLLSKEKHRLHSKNEQIVHCNPFATTPRDKMTFNIEYCNLYYSITRSCIFDQSTRFLSRLTFDRSGPRTLFTFLATRVTREPRVCSCPSRVWEAVTFFVLPFCYSKPNRQQIKGWMGGIRAFYLSNHFIKNFHKGAKLRP
jgi:hypothetical protein